MLDSQGLRVVEPKSDTKRRIRWSLDRGDAAVMAFAVDRRGRGTRWSFPDPKQRMPEPGALATIDEW